MPPCGGAPYCSASSRKPNRSCCRCSVDAQQREHLRLHAGVVDPDRAAAGLAAVDHQVVRLGPHLRRVAVEQVNVLVQRRGERVVHRGPALLLGVVGEHRKLDDPRKMHRLRVVQLHLLADLRAQGVQRLARHLPRVGGEQNEVARLGLHPLGELREQRLVEELGDRASPACRRPRT